MKGLREKVGQLFILGFHGTGASDDLARFIASYHPGGMILFARNIDSPEQAAILINRLQESHTQMPRWISIDHEGGQVLRLPTPFSPLPANGVLGRINSVDIVRSVTAIAARELRAIGVNMNLAPVLDVNTNPRNPIIGDRAFGSDPLRVARLGSVMILEYLSHGIVPCGKHFPGHGDTSHDSHHHLPVVEHGIDRLRAIEFHPFRAAITIGLPTIMTAHVRYPHLDPDYPATLSKNILTTYLREEIGFQGLILTDDLEMEAISGRYDIAEASVLAIEAGADHILICHDITTQTAAMEAVYDAVKRGRISETRIDQSIDRIVELKQRCIVPYQPADPEHVHATVGVPSHRHVIESITGNAAFRSQQPLPLDM